MEDYEVFRIITRMLFSPVEDAAAEIIARIPSIPKHLLTEEFVVQVITILSVKKAILSHRWGKFVDVSYLSIFSSREMYLTLVMSACIREHQKNRNIFESFLSVCALLYVICTETNKKLGANLSYLNPFISMQFYDHISGIIDRNGGVHMLIGYISNHKYLRSKLMDFFPSPDVIESLDESPRDFDSEIQKELERDCIKEEEIDAEKYANDESCLSMAKEILECTTGIKHPSLPSREEVVRSFVAYRKKERAERKLLETAQKSALKLLLDKILNSNTESETNDVAKCQDNIEQYESIIQAVIRHNHSKSSGRKNANNKIQEEANGVLQHLKETVEKLTKVLNEFDKD